MNYSDEEYEKDDILPSYNLAGKTPTKGKFHGRFENGYTVAIHNGDGTTTIKRFPAENMIALAPDLRERFPDAETVDRALRSYLSILDFVEDSRKTA